MQKTHASMWQHRQRNNRYHRIYLGISTCRVTWYMQTATMQQKHLEHWEVFLLGRLLWWIVLMFVILISSTWVDTLVMIPIYLIMTTWTVTSAFCVLRVAEPIATFSHNFFLLLLCSVFEKWPLRRRWLGSLLQTQADVGRSCISSASQWPVLAYLTNTVLNTMRRRSCFVQGNDHVRVGEWIWKHRG